MNKQFNSIMMEVLSPYDHKELSDEIIKELYYILLTKLKEHGWNISEKTEAEPSSMIIINPPESTRWYLIAIPHVFNTVSETYKYTQLSYSYGLMDLAFGC